MLARRELIYYAVPFIIVQPLHFIIKHSEALFCDKFSITPLRFVVVSNSIHSTCFRTSKMATYIIKPLASSSLMSFFSFL